jgi:putative ubiquitin-RnfH superfamily antitoxin RatB of RatAB toxin-antitoxin module
MTAPGRITVAVVYACAGRQVVRPLELGTGATVGEAIRASGLLDDFPDLDPGGRNRVGVFGRIATLQTALRDGDQVEVYRPLPADPKEARRRRAAGNRR